MSNLSQDYWEKYGPCCYTEPKDDSNNNDDKGILNASTATVDPTDRVSETVDDEEDLVDFKFEKMDN